MLKKLTQTRLNQIQGLLNHRPRKCLGYSTPWEVHFIIKDMAGRKQLAFWKKSPNVHGGRAAAGKRKTARPITTKRPMHITLHASQARSGWSLLHPKNEAHIDRFIRQTARKYDLALRRFVNMGNHIHLIIQGKSRAAVQGFLRELSGGISMMITGARKGHALTKRFWDSLAFSRVVEWGRDYKSTMDYLAKNLFERHGLLTKHQKTTAVILAVDCVPQ